MTKTIKNRNSSNSRKSKKRYRKQWFCFGTMTVFSNHKRTAEKYLNQLAAAGIPPKHIEIYQGKGQSFNTYNLKTHTKRTRGGYSRVNICYFAEKRILYSTY